MPAPKISDAAVNITVLALSRMMPKSAIKKLLAEQYNLSARSSERVLARAREEIRAKAGQTIDEHRTDIVSFYRGIISDSAAPLRLKILAAEGLQKLLGLNRPERIEVSGPEGGAIKMESKQDLANLSAEELAVLRGILEKKAQQRPEE